MRLTDASLTIRPRNPWEALDLGILLARRHAGVLMGSWALLTLPLFLLINLPLWNYPLIAFWLFWWLKPAFERLTLHILSQALFGAPPSTKEALRRLPKLLKPQLLASLFWRRLSPTRSFDLPVLQLEGLSGQARGQRLTVLGMRNTGGASWLTIMGSLFEIVLLLGLMSLLNLLLPQQWIQEWQWSYLFDSQTEWLWLDHLRNLFYALVLMVWEPIYVACGFTLYLNRRTELEAWDIELVFRRLRQRLLGSAYVLLLAFSLYLLPFTTEHSWAAEETAYCPVPSDSPVATRLKSYQLNTADSRQAAAEILDAPPFHNREEISGWRLPKEPPKKEQDEKEVEERSLDWLFKALDDWNLFKSAAQVVEVLLWLLGGALLVLLLWRYREWLSLFASRIGLPKRNRIEVPKVLFGLELAPESLPEDVASEAERLWKEQPRAALSLLYRALLSRLLHNFRVPLRSSTTEGEVVEKVGDLDNPPLEHFTRNLTLHWQALAYGHRLPHAKIQQLLCTEWRQLFSPEAQS